MGGAAAGTSGMGGAAAGTSGAGGAAGGTAGASGTTGAGGAAGASDGGTPGSCVDAGQPCGSIALQYLTPNNDRASDAWLRPHINLVNRTTADVPLSELTVRYWYTKDSATSEALTCDFASIGCANIVSTFLPVSPPRAGASDVIDLGFLAAAGTLAAGAQTQEIGLRVGKSDFSNYDETNDYSYDGSLGSLTDYPKITVYRNGVLVWGAEPP
jgi:hypothetical protein